MRLVPAIVVRVFALLALVLDGPLYAQDTVPQVDPDLTHKEHAQAHWMTAAVQRGDCKKPIEARIGDTPLDRSKKQDLGAGSFGLKFAADKWSRLLRRVEGANVPASNWRLRRYGIARRSLLARPTAVTTGLSSGMRDASDLSCGTGIVRA